MKNIALIGAIAAFACAQGGFNGPGRYEIANLKSAKVLDLDRNDQTTVIQFSSRGTDNQRWDVEPADGGFVFFRNSMNGKALQPVRSGNGAELICARFERSTDQQWRIEAGKDGNALIVSRNGRALDIPDGSSRDGLHVQIYDLNGDSNQRFVLRRVGGSVERSDDRDRPRGRGFEGSQHIEDGACFYRERDFRGEAFCTPIGSDVPEARGSFESVRLFGKAQRIEIFERPQFRGERFRVNRDQRGLERRVGSFRVF